MRERASSQRTSRALRFATCLMSVLFLVTASASIYAQSGRRPPKQPSTTDTKPPPEPPAQTPSSTATTPRLPILAVKNMISIGMSTIWSNIALDGCLEELKQSPTVDVSSGKDKTRKEASDYAKASKDTYVLLIQLEQEMDKGTAGVLANGGDPRTLVVSYVLFTPGTGKVKTSGRIYQGTTRGGVGQPVPSTRGISDYELRRCGRDAADRVLDVLNLSRPQRR